MRLLLRRFLQLGLLALVFSACQHRSYPFAAPPAPPAVAPPTVAAPPDPALPITRPMPARAAHVSHGARQLRTQMVPRPTRLAAVRFQPIKPIRMSQQNTQAEPTPAADRPQRRPRITENQLLALALLGGGGALTTAGLLLVFAVGGLGAIIAGVLLGLVGLGMIWGWLYLRGLARAYQH